MGEGKGLALIAKLLRYVFVGNKMSENTAATFFYHIWAPYRGGEKQSGYFTKKIIKSATHIVWKNFFPRKISCFDCPALRFDLGPAIKYFMYVNPQNLNNEKKTDSNKKLQVATQKRWYSLLLNHIDSMVRRSYEAT